MRRWLAVNDYEAEESSDVPPAVPSASNGGAVGPAQGENTQVEVAAKRTLEQENAEDAKRVKRDALENVEVLETQAARKYSEALKRMAEGERKGTEEWTLAKVAFEELVDDSLLKHDGLKLAPKILCSSMRNLATMELEEGNPEKALELLVQSVQLDDGDANVWDRIAELAQSLKNDMLAKFASEEAVRCAKASGRATIEHAVERLMCTSYAMGNDLATEHLAEIMLQLDKSSEIASLLRLLARSNPEEVRGFLAELKPKMQEDFASKIEMLVKSRERHLAFGSCGDEELNPALEGKPIVSVTDDEEITFLSVIETLLSATTLNPESPFTCVLPGEESSKRSGKSRSSGVSGKRHSKAANADVEDETVPTSIQNPIDTQEEDRVTEENQDKQQQQKKTPTKIRKVDENVGKRSSKRVKAKEEEQQMEKQAAQKKEQKKMETAAEELFQIVYGSQLEESLELEDDSNVEDLIQPDPDQVAANDQAELEQKQEYLRRIFVPNPNSKSNSVHGPAKEARRTPGKRGRQKKETLKASSTGSSVAEQGAVLDALKAASSSTFTVWDALWIVLNHWCSSFSSGSIVASVSMSKLLLRTISFFMDFADRVASKEREFDLARFVVISGEALVETFCSIPAETAHNYSLQAIECTVIGRRLLDSVFATGRMCAQNFSFEEALRLSVRNQWSLFRMLSYLNRTREVLRSSLQILAKDLNALVKMCPEGATLKLQHLSTDSVVSLKWVEVKLKELATKARIADVKERFAMVEQRKLDQAENSVDVNQDLASIFKDLFDHYTVRSDDNPSSIECTNIHELIADKQNKVSSTGSTGTTDGPMSKKSSRSHVSVLEILAASYQAAENGPEDYFLLLIKLLAWLQEAQESEISDLQVEANQDECIAVNNSTIDLFVEVLLQLWSFLQLQAKNTQVIEPKRALSIFSFGLRVLPVAQRQEEVIIALAGFAQCFHDLWDSPTWSHSVLGFLIWCHKKLSIVSEENAITLLKGGDLDSSPTSVFLAGELASRICIHFESLLSVLGNGEHKRTIRRLTFSFAWKVCIFQSQCTSRLPIPSWGRSLFLSSLLNLKALFSSEPEPSEFARVFTLCQFCVRMSQNTLMQSKEEAVDLGYKVVKSFTETLASQSTIKKLWSIELLGRRVAMELLRQDAFTDALVLLYGVIEFTTSRKPLPGLFPSKTIETSRAERILRCLGGAESIGNGTLQEFQCGVVGLEGYESDRSILSRYMLNYMESRSSIDAFDFKNPNYMAELMRFLTTRYFVDIDSKSKLDSIDELIGTQTLAHNWEERLVKLREIIRVSQSRRSTYPADIVHPQEVCERVFFYFTEEFQNSRATFNFPVTEICKKSCIERVENLVELNLYIKIDLALNPWRFLSWFRFSEGKHELFLLAMSQPPLCLALLQGFSSNRPVSSSQMQDVVSQFLDPNTEQLFDESTFALRCAIVTGEKDLEDYRESVQGQSSFQPPRLSSVKTNCREGGDVWEPAVISRLNDDGTFDICLTEADELFFGVPLGNLKPSSDGLRSFAQDPYLKEQMVECYKKLGVNYLLSLSWRKKLYPDSVQACASQSFEFLMAAKTMRDEIVDEEEEATVQNTKEHPIVRCPAIFDLLLGRAKEKIYSTVEDMTKVLAFYKCAYDTMVAYEKDQSSKGISFCKGYIMYRLQKARVKFLLENRDSSLELVGARDYFFDPSVLGDREMQTKDISVIINDCLKAFQSQTKMEDFTGFAARYRYAATVISCFDLLSDREAKLETAVGYMDGFVQKNPKPKPHMCAVQYPEWVVRYHIFEVPWLKVEDRRLKYLQVASRVFELAKNEEKLVTLLELLMDKKRWEKDLHRSTFLVAADTVIGSLYRLAIRDLGKANDLDASAKKGILFRLFTLKKQTKELEEMKSSYPGKPQFPAQENLDLENSIRVAFGLFRGTDGNLVPIEEILTACEKEFPTSKSSRKSTGRGKSRSQSLVVDLSQGGKVPSEASGAPEGVDSSS